MTAIETAVTLAVWLLEHNLSQADQLEHNLSQADQVALTTSQICAAILLVFLQLCAPHCAETVTHLTYFLLQALPVSINFCTSLDFIVLFETSLLGRTR
jgi:hypothetical protein